MRLHVAGVSSDISSQDLCAKFASLGTIVDCYRPEPRFLGDEPQHREYAFVEVSDADQARVHKLISAVFASSPCGHLLGPPSWERSPYTTNRCMQLNGSVWHGKKLRISEARPDYRGRHALEEQEAAQTAPTQQEHDEDSDGADRILNIKTPSGVHLPVPQDGSGTRRMIFRPVPPRPMLDLLQSQSEDPGSHLYHLNSLWDGILESAMNRSPPSPTIFQQSRQNVRPLRLDSADNACRMVPCMPMFAGSEQTSASCRGPCTASACTVIHAIFPIRRRRHG